MKRLNLAIFFVLSVATFASAQTITISGTVKTADGDALHLAFVQDKQYKYGAYTDSLGGFSLSVNPYSSLKVSCNGFRDTLIPISNRTTFAVVLRPLVEISANRSNITPQADDHNNINILTMTEEASQVLSNPPGFKRFAFYDPFTGKPVYASSYHFDLAQGSLMPVFMHQEETQGSRYLFTGWVHGYVITAADSIIANGAFYFNYDKMGGALLFSRDKHTAIEVFRENVKSFTVFDGLNQALTFTTVPEIDKTHYVQVISVGSTYSVYKAVSTKFIKANYQSDGLVSTGNNFDLYQDEFTYYLLNVKTNQLQKISLKKKALRQAFSADQGKADAYFKSNDADIDDNYLAAMGDYMNK